VSPGVSLYVIPSVSRVKVIEQGACLIGLEAHYYPYPPISKLVSKPGFGLRQLFHHLREYSPVQFRDVCLSNFETLQMLA